jgi:hypothetical protein
MAGSRSDAGSQGSVFLSEVFSVLRLILLLSLVLVFSISVVLFLGYFFVSVAVW